MPRRKMRERRLGKPNLRAVNINTSRPRALTPPPSVSLPVPRPLLWLWLPLSLGLSRSASWSLCICLPPSVRGSFFLILLACGQRLPEEPKKRQPTPSGVLLLGSLPMRRRTAPALASPLGYKNRADLKLAHFRGSVQLRWRRKKHTPDANTRHTSRCRDRYIFHCPRHVY